MTWDYATISTSQIDPDTGMVTVTAVNEESGEQFPGIDMLHPVGFFSIPYSPTDDGSAQVLVARDVGNTDVAMGGTDERAASAYGAAKPGDAGIFSVGPQHAAKVLCKEDSRTVAAVTEDTNGKNVVLVLNGEKDKVQIAAFGFVFQITRSGGFEMIDNTGASVSFKDGAWTFNCTVNLPNAIAPLRTGSVGGGSPGIPIPGVNCSIP